MALSEEQKEMIDDAISSAAALDEPCMVGTWVLSYEMTNTEGQTYLVHLNSKDSAAWSRMGILKAALLDEQSRWENAE